MGRVEIVTEVGYYTELSLGANVAAVPMHTMMVVPMKAGLSQLLTIQNLIIQIVQLLFVIN